ncbi:AcrR family transcriptional regulator [Actinoalloteichus hoggarensis]|uniref:HTH-type transcriptional repressor KstR2 n=1 Tax=Actinoalloteichus hoggarensis TaxID=1470176 RepID=A0A221VX52_9PSEU|nr:TetR/AcrR family transcriptional regulator [Actinoalloteichus hoggarensis]ASO18085.1 HTH-type transcriptional repressor KstR2 [Actinoalloteichus hoggarensis]MBB5921442.1 AcrR family transcriptional regulator [Actinoalloteichus hoggarensis]
MTDHDTPSSTGAARPLRADARRNRERLILAARELFAEQGVHAPLDAVATRAGVGPGTLYRHFPTRQALVEEVFRDRIESLSALAGELLDAPSPGTALRTWLSRVLADAGVVESMAATAPITFRDDESGRELSCHELLRRSGAALLARAQEAGEIRPDLTVAELIRLVAGVLAAAGFHDPDRVGPDDTGIDRMLTLMLEGIGPRTSPG